MSDGGSPFDPFGRSERTIIRPNPAGRGRRTAPARRAPAAVPPPAPDLRRTRRSASGQATNGP